ncbi:MAG: ABC-F family ATP-binding cassette domain-containing protein [Ardenticatenaceae bacterium]|nr:ABC-F family ATP-binding cassette domain-containing protein [Ardenticatenaceae bacterium]
MAITAHQISKSYNLNPILKNITFTVNPGERVGFIGPNGSGKTTLLRIMAGAEHPDSGHMALSPADLRLGYLAQGFEPDPNLTLGQLLQQRVGDPEAIEAELAQLGLALAEEPEREDLHLAYDAALAKLGRMDNGRIQATLAIFNLHTIDPDLSVQHLSGGQKTRLAMALIILDEPDLLLLDEPTNHLDIEMLEWLESWLADFPGGALIVSHDRTFLDRTVTRIIDLNPETQTIRDYPGSYSDYLDQYLQEQEKLLSAYRDQVYEIRKMRQDIARTKEQALHVERTTKPNQPSVRRLAKKVAKKAKSREKKLDRYLAADERIEKPKQGWQMKLEFGEADYIGRDVLRLENLAVGYPGQPPLLAHLHEEISLGQRVVLTGPNGSGKTTLLRTIAGQIAPLAGQFHLGSSVQMGYMSQEQENLEPDSTPLDTIQAVAAMNQTEARSFLHFFLFAGDDAIRPNAQLSYGERARLALARLVAMGCTFLLLDEPINHLDIPSRTRFEQALTQYNGTILAVVHDRYFIERFATEIWWVVNGRIEAHYN